MWGCCFRNGLSTCWLQQNMHIWTGFETIRRIYMQNCTVDWWMRYGKVLTPPQLVKKLFCLPALHLDLASCRKICIMHLLSFAFSRAPTCSLLSLQIWPGLKLLNRYFLVSLQVTGQTLCPESFSLNLLPCLMTLWKNTFSAVPSDMCTQLNIRNVASLTFTLLSSCTPTVDFLLPNVLMRSSLRNFLMHSHILFCSSW